MRSRAGQWLRYRKPAVASIPQPLLFSFHEFAFLQELIELVSLRVGPQVPLFGQCALGPARQTSTSLGYEFGLPLLDGLGKRNHSTFIEFEQMLDALSLGRECLATI